MNKFEENKLLQEEIKSKRTELEVLERKLKKLGNCYIIFSDGTIDERPIDLFHTAINVDCYYQGNLFDSKEDAQREVKRRNLLTRFRKFRDGCNGDWKPDWCNPIYSKYFILLSKNEISMGSSCCTNFLSEFGYFKNFKDCKKAIELFGDEIKALFADCEGD